MVEVQRWQFVQWNCANGLVEEEILEGMRRIILEICLKQEMCCAFLMKTIVQDVPKC